MSSKKEKSAIVRGAGLLTSIFTNLQKEVEKRGGDGEDIHRLTTPEGEGILGEIAEIIVKASYPRKEDFKITVNYEQSLQQMIKAGNYDWVNNNITAEHFPVEGKDKQELTITLFHFNKPMTSDEIKNEMEKQDFRPAKVEELLALGEKYPELQKKFLIAALDSVWQDPNGSRLVPYLSWGGVRRDLYLCRLGDVWVAGWRWRFVALRK